jgi:phage shock protein PspC (stress-responsive transcriptional regulator)
MAAGVLGGLAARFGPALLRALAITLATKQRAA